MHTILLVIAKYLFVIVGLLAFAYWLTVSKQEKIRLIVFGAIACVTTFALIKIGAAIYYDPRPFTTHHLIPLYPHADRKSVVRQTTAFHLTIQCSPPLLLLPSIAHQNASA
jgi:hypothetical protein